MKWAYKIIGLVMLRRLFDITAATTASVSLLPIYAIKAYIGKKKLSSSVLSRQTH